MTTLHAPWNPPKFISPLCLTIFLLLSLPGFAVLELELPRSLAACLCYFHNFLKDAEDTV